MTVLCDHHHGALLRSMHYLFKKRLHMDLYVPIGFDWLDKDGLYSCYPNRDTANQMLNTWLQQKNYVSMFTPITLKEFIDKDIDIVVVSLWENYKIFDNIIKKYNKKSKLILQVGNNIIPEQVYMCGTKNLLSSAYPTYIKSNIHKVFYHQEFNTELFKPQLPSNINSVANFKHVMEDDFNILISLEKRLPNWEFKCYGAQNRDGGISDSEEEMSYKMKQFGFIFHVKRDDGYGHVIHNSFACGKPMIVDLNTAMVFWNGQYIRNTASFLFEKNQTVIDSNDTIDDMVYNLEKVADNYESYSDNVYKKFTEVANFEKEGLEIKTFIETLI